MACRNRRWPIHRFSSTSVRCMTAIWPAGPPKVCREMANHARTAVRKGTTSAGSRRSVSLVTGTPGSGRLAAEQGAATVVLVEAVEQRAGHGQGLLVAAGHGEAAEQDVEAGRLRGVEPVVVQVGHVH